MTDSETLAALFFVGRLVAAAATFLASRSIFAQFEFFSTEAKQASEITVDLAEADLAFAFFIPSLTPVLRGYLAIHDSPPNRYTPKSWTSDQKRMPCTSSLRFS
jgi:hypothetical protein